MLSPLFCLMYLQDNLKIHSSLNIRLYRENTYFARVFRKIVAAACLFRSFNLHRIVYSLGNSHRSRSPYPRCPLPGPLPLWGSYPLRSLTPGVVSLNGKAAHRVSRSGSISVRILHSSCSGRATTRVTSSRLPRGSPIYAMAICTSSSISTSTSRISD